MRAMFDFVPNEKFPILNLGFSWHYLWSVHGLVNQKVHKDVDHKTVNFLRSDLRIGQCSGKV